MNANWIILALSAMFISSFHTIIHKYITLFNKKNTNISVAFVFIFTGILSFLYLLYNKTQMIDVFNNKKFNIIILLSLLLSFVILSFNICMSNAIKMSPNAAYCLLIVNFNIILTFILACYLFNQKINSKTFTGILISFFGIGMVIYYSNE